MNKTTKKNKVDKCPSTLENKVKDVHSNLTSNEKSQELMELNNGLTNGIGLNDEITTEKGSRKNKKNKYKNGGHVDLRKDHLSDGTCITKTVSTDARNIDQSSESKKNKLKSDNTVNSVNSNFKGNTKAEIGSLDSNDDNCCDENTSCGPLIETIGINQAVSSSSKTIHNSDCDPKPNELKLEITESSLLEVSETLKDIHLGNKLEAKETIETKPVIHFKQYESELQMPMIMKIIQKDLSEPYSIYTYRYFIHNWPKLCFLAMCEDECVGAIVCKLDVHRKVIKRGYIAMLAVDQNYRKLRIGSNLVQMAINEMIQGDADEVVLETEVTNKPALQLYEKLGFVRDKRLFRYYLNGVDALRLKLWLR